MFIRFVLTEVDEDSRRRKGALVAAHELKYEGDLDTGELRRLMDVLAWFNEHLPIPPELDEDGNHRALSWFKPEAADAIAQMWLLVHLLRSHGMLIEVLKTDDPGSVLYEDEQQIVAKPRRGRRVPW